MAFNFLPVANGSGSLGTTTDRWGNAYVNSLDVSGSVAMDEIQFNTALANPVHSTGNVYWDSDNGTLSVDMLGSDVRLQVGLETLVYARNRTGQTITNGQVVRINGASGNKVTIDLAIAEQSVIDEIHTGNEAIGIVTADIANNSNGYVCVFGAIREIDTSAYADGATLYLSHTESGSLTDTAPPAPYDNIRVGIVERSNATEGVIFVNVQESLHMSEIATFSASSVPTGKSYLVHDTATGIVDLTQELSGSFSGSFQGDGSGLTNVSATAEAGGSEGDIQFNRLGAGSGSANLNYNITNNVFSIDTGIVQKTVRITSSAYTVEADDYRLGIRYTPTGSVQINFPDVTTLQPNQEFKIKDEGFNASVNPITIVPSGSQSIENDTSFSIEVDGGAITVYTDGVSNLYIE